VSDEHSWGFMQWLSGIATFIASAAFGFVFSARDRMTRLEQRVEEHDRANASRGPVIYDTQRRVDQIQSDIARINEKLTEQKERGEQMQTGIDELLRRLPRV